ncbi:Lipase class 3 [Crenothrix polyspora]|uniref:Lipase class 3 n=1 Tax=Crenothrix polyspora TaxID=360316 RepID=A0A1R4H5R4_9GAMM|nr:lipase family protein [Crenothrix polyspora]SJM91516.1 Lipase class 3 [Crenothrix polyspora]
MINLSIEPQNTQFSLKNAYGLALASRLAYQSEDEIRNKCQELGFNAEFINEPSTDTQLFVAHNGTAVVISFRGTEKFKDWLTNAGVEFHNTPNGRVHKGFDRALNSVWNRMTKALEKAHRYGQPIWITGHSLGGALAALAAARLTLDIDESVYKSINGLYTFGQPRVGDRVLVKALDDQIKPRYFRFVNDNDMVPRIPDRLNQYQDGGFISFFDAKGELHHDVSFWFAFLERIKGSYQQKLDMIPSFIEHHFIDKYIANIEKNMNG